MSCVAMCFNAGPRKEDTDGMTKGIRRKPKQIAMPKPEHPQMGPLPHSEVSSPYATVANPVTLARINYERKLDSPSENSLSVSDRQLAADAHSMPNIEVESSSASPPSESMSSSSAKFEQSELLPSATEKSRQDGNKSTFTSAQIIGKMNAKQMKGAFTGMGKELKKAATTVGEKMPNQLTKKKRNARKDREGLVGNGKPQPRNPEEIKRAYGHSNDTRHVAAMAHDKLRERGEKLSAINRRTTELESDASNFSSLASELVKKMENRKWYEM